MAARTRHERTLAWQASAAVYGGTSRLSCKERMKQIAKLKDEARKYEQREEWDRAIQAYGEVLRLGEAGDGAELDLPLYNRVGDLYVRLGRSAEAVKYYEQA